MIRRSDITPIGDIHKPHGIRGELSATLDEGIDPRELRCIVLDIDGIYVPFFIGAARERGTESWLIKIDGIDDEKAAMRLARHEIFAMADEVADDDDNGDGVHLYDLIGYELTDAEGTPVGRIADIDDSTANVLLTVETADGRDIFIPFADELLTALDPETRTAALDLPDGLINLND
ncbi:MAG: ribosome maturation factor RimM [Bacteroidales bacterium]|nr:ribosome maturation factor RimM [Bacteroidales bacterium]